MMCTKMYKGRGGPRVYNAGCMRGGARADGARARAQVLLLLNLFLVVGSPSLGRVCVVWKRVDTNGVKTIILCTKDGGRAVPRRCRGGGAILNLFFTALFFMEMLMKRMLKNTSAC